MSLAIVSNPSYRRWKPIEEQPRTSDDRMRRIYQYYQQLRGDLPKKIKRSYLFIDGRQPYDKHFQRVFKECYIQLRGTTALVDAVSNTLKYKFEHFPDVCIRIEVPLYYDEDTGSTPVNVIRNPNPELQEKLKSILDRTRGLQQELLWLLEQEGKKLHPELKADDLDCFPKDSIEGFRQTHPFSLYPLALVFSTVLPKCSDVFKDILSQLLQLAWLEEQLPAIGNPIGLPSKAASTLVEFPFRGMQYILSKTNDDGACALHALLGEPVNGEYRYAGPDNVRELFAKSLDEKMRSSAVVRTKVTNIIYSHLDRPDASSELLFAGKSGQALRIAYCLSRAGVDQFVQEANQAEAGIWQLQIAKPHIREKLLAEAKLKRRYAGMTKDAILRKLEEYPELILSLVNESPDEFLRLLDSPTYWRVLDIRSQRQECLEWAGINRKLFAINQLYPHYLEVIKDPRYFFNTQELELAATLFGKKMQAIQFLNDRLEIATEMINEELPGDPIIIFHGGVHFSRCRPKERFDTVGSLYQEANAHATKLVEWDEQSSKRFVSTLKDEASHLAISGLVSAGTRSPLPIYGQLLRTLTNVCGAKVDPFNQHKSTQAAKLLVNSAGSYALGGGVTQVGKALAIDAWAALTAPTDMSKSESAKRSFGVSLLKGLGGNDKEFLDSVIGGIISGGLSLVTPEEQEGEGWVKRVLRALPTNSDIHKTIQDLAVKSLEAPSKKTAGGKLEDKLKDYKKRAQEIEDEVFDGPWLEEYSTWKAEEEKAAREKIEAKTQARKKLAKDLREQLTGIKEQGLEGEWLDKLAQEGRSSGGMEAKINTAVDPVDVSFEQAEPPHVIRQKTEATIEKIKEKIDLFNKKEDALKVGAENILNLQQAGSHPSDINKAIQAFNSVSTEKSDLGKEINGLCQILNGIDSTFEPMLIEETSPQTIPLIPLKVEIKDEKRYQRLVQEQGQNYVEREQRKNDWETKDKAAKKAAKKEEELHNKNKKTRFIPRPSLYKKWQESIKDLQTKNQEVLDAKNLLDEIDTKIYNNSKEQLEASAPKNPTALHDKQLSEALFKLNFYDREVTNKTDQLQNAIIKYNKKGLKDKHYDEVKLATKSLNHTIQDRTNALNEVNRLQGNESDIKAPSFRAPPKATGMQKALRWINENVEISSHETPRPINYDPEKPIPPPSSKGSTYAETRHQIAVEKSELSMIEAPVKKPSAQPSQYNWSAFQKQQQQKMLDTNMSFKSPQQSPSIDYGPLKDLGMPLPPTTTAQAIQSGTKAPETQRAVMKRYPEVNRTQSNIPTWLRYFASGGEPLDPQERIDQNTQILVAHTKAAAKTFGQIAEELRSFGCINAKFDHGKVTLKFDRTISDKLDQFVTQHLPDMSHVRNFHYLEFTAGLANDAMLQVFAMPFFRVAPRITMTRRVVSIEEKAATRMAEQMAFLERMNSPAYRSGFVSESTVAKLTERQIRVITPVKLPPVQVGEELTWLSNNLPKVRQLQQVKPHRFDQYLKATFRDQKLSETQIRRILNYSGFETYPRPIGLPENIVVELSKKNGGMTFRLAGTTTDQNLVVRVCPGLAKESIVSSVMKGKHLNGEMHGTLRQQYPYVVQRKGKLTLTKNGEWIDLKDPCNKGKEALTHIRLEEYQFKGWE